METDRFLMVFIKNPEKGLVKSRLAKDVGEEKALHIYKLLLDHTLKISSRIDCSKGVFYSRFIVEHDSWFRDGFKQYLQNGRNLGERMLNSFKLAFINNYKYVIIIGSDCFDITSNIIEDAFNQLRNNDVVIGPAKDGGYYLLGMKELHSELFVNKVWSTENVLVDTLLDLKKLNLKYNLLPTLSDVDRIEDLGLTQIQV